jgi:hypothetical protein
MSALTESFAALSEILLADAALHKVPLRETFISRALKPMLPASLRIGTGQIVDIKDRQTGPFDIVGCSEVWPPIGEGVSTQFIADGVAFCIQVRDWKEEDLTQFAEMAARLKAVHRKSKFPLLCAVAGFKTLPAAQVTEFMKSSGGHAIDGIISVGEHALIRNSQGWYGDPKEIPFVSAKGEGESLKGFLFWLLHAAQSFVGIPFQLGDYQHL